MTEQDYITKQEEEQEERLMQEAIEEAEKQDSAKWIDDPVEKLPTAKGDYKLTLYMSTDGKHTVNVEVTDPKERHEAVKKAMELYDYIVTRYGTKQAQAVKEYSTEKKTPDPNCKHPTMKFMQVKKEGKNQGKWFKSCASCGAFLGFQS